MKTPPAAPPTPELEPWDHGRWVLTFEAAGCGPPMVVRVRRLLKAALRGYGLKAIEARQEAHATGAKGTTGEGKPGEGRGTAGGVR